MEYIIAGAALAVLIGVCFIVMRYCINRDNKECQQMTDALSDEQKNRLAQTEINFVKGSNSEWIFVNGSNSEWIQEGIIGKMTEKGKKVHFRILWYNKVINNNSDDRMDIGDASLSKAEADEHNLKEGDFVNIYIAPLNTKEPLKIIFR